MFERALGRWHNSLGQVGLTGADAALGSPCKPAREVCDVGHLVGGQDVVSGARAHWSMLIRGAAMAFATLAVAALAFAARADALIYWANANTNSIGRANLDGTGANGGFIKVVGGFPNGVAADGAHVYWTVPNANTIGRANLDGTGTNQSFITGANVPEGVAVANGHLYWTNDGNGTIGSADLVNGTVDQRFITGANGSNLLAADASHLYWTVIGSQFNPNTIARADLPNGSNVNPSFIGLGSGTPEGVAVDSAHVYWTDLLGQQIGRANIDGTGPEKAFIGGAAQPHRHRGRRRARLLVQLRQQRDRQRQYRRLQYQPALHRRRRARRGGGRRDDRRPAAPADDRRPHRRGQRS